MTDPVFFFHQSEKPYGVFSQWHKSPFGGCSYRKFSCMEQYMMCEKAQCFDDEEAERKILAAKTPAEIKRLGRTVQGFADETWNLHKFNIVVQGNTFKFQQNPWMRSILLGTGDRLLVEASPFDKIWGIGLDAAHAKLVPPERWPGQNLLGKALMKVRDILKEDPDGSKELAEVERLLGFEITS